jgi:uncharacterized Zn-finger protein
MEQAKEVVKVKRSALPLYCPNSAHSVWSEHPKVYLPITEGQTISCPYCGRQYECIPD